MSVESRKHLWHGCKLSRQRDAVGFAPVAAYVVLSRDGVVHDDGLEESLDARQVLVQSPRQWVDHVVDDAHCGVVVAHGHDDVVDLFKFLTMFGDALQFHFFVV